MDLSAVIFVVLAIGWAVYLIPKALQHHDELAGERLVEGHSDDVRVLSRPGRQASVVQEQVDTDQPVVASTVAVAVAPVPTLAAARRAARNRRRVLGVLTLALAVVAGLAGFGLAPWWSVSIPAGLIVVFLVVARISVRRTQRARRAAGPTAVVPVAPVASPATEIVEAAADLDDTEDTVGVPRQELEAALADEGSLWDPLPVTLPTYVGKARARRTVRTIELTGINSSGHDETDSALAREAQATAATQAAEAEVEAEQRRVAGA